MTSAIPVQCSTNWAMKPCRKQVRCRLCYSVSFYLCYIISPSLFSNANSAISMIDCYCDYFLNNYVKEISQKSLLELSEISCFNMKKFERIKVIIKFIKAQNLWWIWFSNTPHWWTDTQGCGAGLLDAKLRPFKWHHTRWYRNLKKLKCPPKTTVTQTFWAMGGFQSFSFWSIALEISWAVDHWLCFTHVSFTGHGLSLS